MPSLKTDVDEESLPQASLSRLGPDPHEVGELSLRKSAGGSFHAAILLLVALGAVSITGYHPYAEDAGIYVAAIKRAIDPSLYGTSVAFLTPYLRTSLFPEVAAWIVRLLHVPLEPFLFAFQIVATWLLVFACWELGKRCFSHAEERWAAVLLTATCLSVPVAGTSLFLMDPYLTGRSFSTPLSLLAICSCLDRKFFRTALFLLMIGLFHPLMVIYASFFILLLWMVQAGSWPGAAALTGAGFVAAAAVQFLHRGLLESVAYQNAIGSRYYFFLENWHWYEQFGLAAPLLIFTVYFIKRRPSLRPQGTQVARACVILGLVSVAVSLLFARPSSRSHLVAALQPLRPFLLIYFCMFLLLGGLIGRLLFKRSAWHWIALFGSVGVGLAFVQHQSYPASPQIELPGVASTNGWTRAFVWIRANTPPNARFALDSDYIHVPGEDGQGFRALAERDVLADRSKDGGAAAVFSQLADRWWIEQTATSGLNQIDDRERLRRLAPFEVDWIVLNAGSRTSLNCPFVDDAVRVCRLH